MDNRSRPSAAPALTWAEAQAPVLGLCAAAVLALAALTLDTVLAGAGEPGAILDWFPLAAAGVALLAALRGTGALREGALAAMVGFLAMVPLLHPAPAPWMYAVPLAAAVVALGVTLAPTTRAVVALPALGGLLAMMELVREDGLATLLGGMVFAAYLVVLGLELPSLTLPSFSGRAAPDARETGEQA